MELKEISESSNAPEREKKEVPKQLTFLESKVTELENVIKDLGKRLDLVVRHEPETPMEEQVKAKEINVPLAYFVNQQTERIVNQILKLELILSKLEL